MGFAGTLTNENCAEAAGTVVVIDVLRAFTTAAMAFHRGVLEIALADTVERALALREAWPGALVAGEVDARPVPGFDLHNSPSLLAGSDLAGRRLVLRTTAGTQGVIRARRASRVLCASFANVSATARVLAGLAGPWWTVITGHREEDRGEEDAACSRALEALAAGRAVDWAEIEAQVRAAQHAQNFAGAEGTDFPRADLDWACRRDWLDRPLLVQRRPLGALGEVPMLAPGTRIQAEADEEG